MAEYQREPMDWKNMSSAEEPVVLNGKNATKQWGFFEKSSNIGAPF